MGSGGAGDFELASDSPLLEGTPLVISRAVDPVDALERDRRQREAGPLDRPAAPATRSTSRRGRPRTSTRRSTPALRPSTKPVHMVVTGVVRFPGDLELTGPEDVSGKFADGYVNARRPVGPAVPGIRQLRLCGRGAPGPRRQGQASTRVAARKDLEGPAWQTQPAVELNRGAVEDVIDTERRGVLLFAAIAAAATSRVRGIDPGAPAPERGAGDSSRLVVGRHRARELAAGAVLRGVWIAVPAGVLASLTRSRSRPMGPSASPGAPSHDLGLELRPAIRGGALVIVVLVRARPHRGVAVAGDATRSSGPRPTAVRALPDGQRPRAGGERRVEWDKVQFRDLS